jgi:hypothetical protein
MPSWIRLAGDTKAVELFGIKLVVVNADNGGIASATFELVGDPKMRVALDHQ